MENRMVSIIVPVYNVENYLQRCLDSLCRQTYKNIEIILVNDGSVDNSGLICDKYAVEYDFIQVIHKKNGGLSAARNSAIDIAKGEFFTFVDSDDYIPPNYIEYLYNLMVRYSADITICQPLEFSDVCPICSDQKTKERLRIMEGAEALENLLYRKYFFTSAWGKLYKRELWDDIRFPVNRLHEDYGTIYKVVALSKKTICSNLPLYYYYQRKGSIIHSKNFNNKLEILAFDNEMNCFISNNDSFTNLNKAMICRHFVSNIQILRWIPKEEETKHIISNIKQEIASNRKYVLLDKKAKFSTRILAFCSFFTIEGLRIAGIFYNKFAHK